MTFTSIFFIVFLLGVYLIFRVSPQKYRWGVLLIASYVFYSTLNVPYLILAIIFITAATFVGGIQISKSITPQAKLAWLWFGITVNVGILVSLKYIPFILDNVSYFTDVEYAFGRQIVSIGVSFYTFQAISYLTDIYLEIQEPEKHLGRFSLYLSFFPKLLQGPIERASALLPQLRSDYHFDADDLKTGINLFLWGLFKKVVIADRLALAVDAVYQNVHDHSGISLVLATYCYALQIYFDFSGYTDMALGIARVFNIRLTQNFNNPYLSTSIADFWRRWHISFSTWILDYIFKPLQFEFRKWVRWGTPLALIITFLVSGVWHGASWCFIVWGGIHGLYLAGSAMLSKPLSRVYKRFRIDKSQTFKIVNIVITFHMVCFAWIFFRSKTLADSVYIVSKIMTVFIDITVPKLISDSEHILQLLGKQKFEIVIILLLTALTLLIESLRHPVEDNSRRIGLSWLAKMPCWMQGTAYGLILYFSLFYGVSTQSFIYFQF